jgi:chromosome segregation ATPase
MSFVGLLLQALISVLLIAGFAYGLRLHRKLDELKASQAGFVQAVAELDRAAARAEAGLAALRESSDIAREELADRIDSARKLVRRLEEAASDAALTLKRLEAAQRAGLASPVRAEPATRAGDTAASEARREPSSAPPERPQALSRPPAAIAPDRPTDGPAPSSASERLRRLTELLRAPEDSERKGGRK